MPITSSFSGASARALGFTSSGYTAIGNGYWINRTSKASTNVYSYAKSMAVDSSGNMYYVGYSYAHPSGTDYSQNVVKYNSSGEIVWQRSLDTAGIVDAAYSVSLDSSGNVYVFGTGTANSYGTYIKFNSSGVLQWQKRLTDSFIYVFPQDSVVDSSGNLYLSGITYNNTTNTFDATVIKFDSSGNITWQRRAYTNNQDTFNGIALDASNNVYVCGSSGNFGGVLKGIVVKYDSSGGLQWQREFSSSYTVDSQSIICDSTGAVYVASFYSDSSGGTKFGSLIKYNSSGVLQWQTKTTYLAYSISSSTNTNAMSLAVDSSDNIYIISTSSQYTTAGGTTYGSPNLIQKFNSSGTQQWARNFNLDNYIGDGYATIAVNGSDYYIYFTASFGAEKSTLGAKLPTNGSKAGQYKVGPVNITYNAVTTTVTSGTLIEAAGSLTDTAGSITSSSASLTDTANNLTVTIRD